MTFKLAIFARSTCNYKQYFVPIYAAYSFQLFFCNGIHTCTLGFKQCSLSSMNKNLKILFLSLSLTC